MCLLLCCSTLRRIYSDLCCKSILLILSLAVSTPAVKHPVMQQRGHRASFRMMTVWDSGCSSFPLPFLQTVLPGSLPAIDPKHQFMELSSRESRNSKGPCSGSACPSFIPTTAVSLGPMQASQLPLIFCLLCSLPGGDDIWGGVWCVLGVDGHP